MTRKSLFDGDSPQFEFFDCEDHYESIRTLAARKVAGTAQDYRQLAQAARLLAEEFERWASAEGEA